MPDRILRDELLESDRWLGLARNTHRLAFVCLIPNADALGNMEATDGHLWRVWRDTLRLDSRAAVPEILEALVAVDLVRLYEGRDKKRYLHIPRSRQELRYLGRVNPPSPWTTEEEKQRLGKNSRRAHDVVTCEPRSEVKRSEVDVEVKRKEKKKTLATPTITREALPPQVKTVFNIPQVNSETEEQYQAKIEANRQRLLQQVKDLSK